MKLANWLITILLIGMALAAPFGAAQAQQVAVEYPTNIKTDYEKLGAVYSLIEQLRLEHNKVGALARSDWKNLEGKWKAYAEVWWSKTFPLLEEQNRLRDSIRKASYTDEEWRKLSEDQRHDAFFELYGDKQALKILTTKAMYGPLNQVKKIDFYSLDPKALPDPTEDFTTYDETDDDEDITVTSSKVAVDTMRNDAVSYVVKDKGSGHFGDFEHLIKVTYTSVSGNRGQIVVWSVGNIDHPTRTDLDADNVGILVYNYSWTGQNQFKLRDEASATEDTYSDTTEYPYTRWLTIERSGTTATCKIYGDSDRTDLKDTLTLTCAETTYQYISPLGSSDSDGSYGDITWTLDVEDLDLQEGGVSAPTVVTNAASSVEETTATLSGNITATGGENADYRGFEWDTDSGAPYSSNWTEEGDYGVGNFTHGITGLTKGELYYYRAIAHNSGGWGYGSEVTFLTKPDEPTSLAKVATTSTTIQISWSKGTGAQKTMVRYRTDGTYPTGVTDGTQAYFDTGEGTTITSLPSGQEVKIRAWSYATEGGLEQYSDNTADLTEYTNPGDVTDFDASNPSSSTIDLSWTKGTGGDKTMVRRKTGSYPSSPSDGNQVYFDTGASTQDTGLDPNTQYFYAAWGYDSDSGYYSDNAATDNETTLANAPSVTTNAATNVEETTATLNGDITDIGGENASERGFEWDTDSGAPYTDNWTEEGSFGTGAFNHGITGLTKGELYYFRAMAENSAGWGYGDELTFLTKPDEPTGLGETSTGTTWIMMEWTKGDGAQKTLLRYKTGSYPSSITDGTQAYFDTGSSVNVTSLDPNVTYYFRAWSYATEGGLEQYSDATSDDTAATQVGMPQVTNDGATGVTHNSARLNGTIDDTGGDNPTVTAFWGESDGGEDPESWSNNASLGAKGLGAFYYDVSDLDPETLYYFTFRAVNGAGTDWSSSANFTTTATPPPPPEATPGAPSPASSLVSEQDYSMAIMLWIPLGLLMMVAFWQGYPVLFIVTGAASLGVGLIAPDIYGTDYGLVLGMALIAYALFNLGMAYKYMFWEEAQ